MGKKTRLKYNKILFCGPSGSGKTTWATTLKRVVGDNLKVFILDGDELRETINSDLDFSPESVKENARRITKLSDWLIKYQGADIVICSVIMGTEESRELFKEGGFLNVFVERKSIVAEDLKGLYSSGKATPWFPDKKDSTIDLIVDNNENKCVLADVCTFFSSKIKK